MKTLITIILIICFLGCQTLTANPPNSGPPQPKWCLVCCLIVIGIAVCGVMIYGLWKMCKNIPGNQPANQDTNQPPVVGIDAVTSLPPLQLEGGNNAVLQSSDGSGTWQTVATFTVTTDGTNMLIAALDPMGRTMGTTTSKLYTGNPGLPTAVADFSKLTVGGTNGAVKLFRLVGTQ